MSRRNRTPEMDLATGPTREQGPGDVPAIFVPPAVSESASASRSYTDPPTMPTVKVRPTARMTASPPAPDLRGQTNTRRRAAAHKWLDKYLDDAESEQIDDRPFYGHVIIDIPVAAGTFQEVKASKTATDRVN